MDFSIDESLYTNNICGIFQVLSRLKSSSQEMPGKGSIVLIYAKNPGFAYAVFGCRQALERGSSLFGLIGFAVKPVLVSQFVIDDFTGPEK